MPWFKFELIHMLNGKPNFLACNHGLSHTPSLSGCAMVVVEEFPDEETARNNECCHDDHGNMSELWVKHQPNVPDSHRTTIGLTVKYIGPVTDEDNLEYLKKFDDPDFVTTQGVCKEDEGLEVERLLA